jgi:translation initiation factor RLI1
MYNFNLNDPNFLPHCGCELQLSMEPGEVVTIVGENGLGKTTLVHRFYDDHRNRMTLIDQKNLDIFYDRNLVKLKQIFLESRESMINKEFFLECWNLFGLDKKEGRMQSSLSGGEGQVLKICLGLARETDIYVLDEPSQYLDSNMKIILSDLISNLIGKKKTVIMVEHDLTWQKFPMTINKLKIHENNLVKESSWNT